jgi:urease accessory protein
MLLKLTARVPAPPETSLREIVLSYAQRSRSRLRSVLEDGTEVGLFLPRGTQLRGGDGLLAETGEVIRVRAAIEPLYRVTAAADASDPEFALLRAAYHLGNRHIPLALSPTELLLEPDPVLRDMLLGLGMVVSECAIAFEPEPGAYGGGHRHDHDEHAGSVGELLSQQAHARSIDMTTLQFHR